MSRFLCHVYDVWCSFSECVLAVHVVLDICAVNAAVFAARRATKKIAQRGNR
jgi:hypothetical protein